MNESTDGMAQDGSSMSLSASLLMKLRRLGAIERHAASSSTAPYHGSDLAHFKLCSDVYLGSVKGKREVCESYWHHVRFPEMRFRYLSVSSRPCVGRRRVPGHGASENRYD